MGISVLLALLDNDEIILYYFCERCIIFPDFFHPKIRVVYYTR